MIRSRPRPSSLAPAYFLYFTTTGLIAPYFPAFLAARGLDTIATGWLLAAGPLARVFFPPLIGLATDAAGARGEGEDAPRRALRVVAAGALVATLVIASGANAAVLVAGTLLYYLFVAPVIPLLDSLAVRQAARRGKGFGRVRLWGSIGFLLTSASFGWLSPHLSAASVAASLVASHLLFALFLLLPTRGAPKRDGDAPRADDLRRDDGTHDDAVRQTGVMSAPVAPSPVPHAEDSAAGGSGVISAWREARASLRQPALLLLLSTLFLNRLASAPFNGFYTIFVRDLGLGGDVVAWSWALGVSTEVLFMLVIDRLIARSGFAPVLVAGVLLEALRWFALSLTETRAELLLVAPFHGIAFTMLYVASVRGLARVVPAGLQTFGQTAGAAATGFGQTAGLILAGYLHDAAGNTGMFFVAGCVGVLTTANAVSLTWLLRKER